MDATSALKKIFRPIATISLPAYCASTPLLIIVADLFAQNPIDLIDHRPVPVGIAVLVVSLMIGLILENLGSHYENRLDQKLLNDFPNLIAVWNAYLCLQMKDEVIGQRFLQATRLLLKFELAMVPALIAFMLGVAWLNLMHHFWSWWPTFTIFFPIFFLLVRFLCFEAYRSAASLAETRVLLVALKPQVARELRAGAADRGRK